MSNRPCRALQVISVVTGGGADGMGLFFPEGLNGAINGSSAIALSTDAGTTGRRKLKVGWVACGQSSHSGAAC